MKIVKLFLILIIILFSLALFINLKLQIDNGYEAKSMSTNSLRGDVGNTTSPQVGTPAPNRKDEPKTEDVGNSHVIVIRAILKSGIGDSAVIAHLEKNIAKYRNISSSLQDWETWRAYVFASTYHESEIWHWRPNGKLSINTNNEDGSSDFGAMQINDLSNQDCFMDPSDDNPGICHWTKECQNISEPKAYDLECNVAAGVYSHYINYQLALQRGSKFAKYCVWNMSTFDIAMKIYNGGENSFNSIGCNYALDVKNDLQEIFTFVNVTS